MKNNSASDSGASKPRVLIAIALCSTGPLLALLSFGLFTGAPALAQRSGQSREAWPTTDVVPMIGPVSQDHDLRTLPYIPPAPESEEHDLRRYPQTQSRGTDDPVLAVQQIAQAAAMPAPLLTFDGINATQSGCGCLPPDTDGDVGPSHYVQSVNSSIKIFDKTGNALNGVNGTTYNSFFSAMGPATPCGSNQNNGDGLIIYDHLADRWVVSDFAFAGSSGTSFYQCIGVSKTSDPVAGGWWLYALQIDPANPTFLGDVPKLGLWPDAYYLAVNLFANGTTFNGVRVFALDRSRMLSGTSAPNPGAVAFTISPATLGDTYSLLPATLRAGSAPPMGTPEYFMAIDSPGSAGVVQTRVKTWLFHVDFATPSNSTFGVGTAHTPNGTTAVNGFVNAFTSTGNIVPQPGTTSLLHAQGDHLMTPLVYQNLGGTESLWASHTVNNNQNGTGPTAIRWYQFNVTGSTIPAAALQQQTFNNGADGLWRFMPSISVDANGSMAIGYSVSSSVSEPSIRYAGRLASDPLNALAQAEAVLIAGGGHQTNSSGRWGDYSAMSIDPSDNLTFWYTSEYYPVTSSASWFTRIGKFKFPPTLFVTTLDDHNDGACDAADCTLREAITAANADSGRVIGFAPGVAGTIQLTGALPSLSSNMTMVGPGANLLSVRRNTGGDYRIFNVASASVIVSISGLTIANGNVPGLSYGGGISNAGTLTLTNTAIAGNTAGFGGGGIYNDFGATATITSSTISTNSAGSVGGIFNNGTLNLSNSTISGNTATSGNGGGIAGGIVVLTNSTISANSASGSGGGVFQNGTNGGSVKSRNTIIALNTAPSGPDVNGPLTSQGFNIIGTSSGATITPAQASDKIGVSAAQLKIASLQDNGGGTMTHALLSGSVAIDQGNSGTILIDQRGFVRTAVADIGAFEFNGAPMQITSITRLTNGHILLTGVGVPNATHTIAASPDLNRPNFISVGSTTANASGVWQFDDAGPMGVTMRFYRASFP